MLRVRVSLPAGCKVYFLIYQHVQRLTFSNDVMVNPKNWGQGVGDLAL